MHEEFKEDIKQIKDDVANIRTDLAVIKTDIAHHIKRTDLAELRITRAENWSLGIFATIAAGVIIAAVKVVFFS